MRERLKDRLKPLGLTPEAVDSLLDNGYLSMPQCVCAMVKHDVDAYYKAGCGKREAIQLAADDYGISYETALNYVYKKNDVKSL